MIEYAALTSPISISIVVCIVWLKKCNTKEKFIGHSLYLMLCIWSAFCLWNRLMNLGSEVIICFIISGCVAAFLWNIQCSKRFFMKNAFEAWKVGCFLICFIGTTTIFGYYYIDGMIFSESIDVKTLPIWNDILPNYLLFGINYFWVGIQYYFFEINSAMFILQKIVGAIWLGVIVPPVFTFMQKILTNENVAAKTEEVVDLNEVRNRKNSTTKNHANQRQKAATAPRSTRKSKKDDIEDFFNAFENIK